MSRISNAEKLAQTITSLDAAHNYVERPNAIFTIAKKVLSQAKEIKRLRAEWENSDKRIGKLVKQVHSLGGDPYNQDGE